MHLTAIVNSLGLTRPAFHSRRQRATLLALIEAFTVSDSRYGAHRVTTEAHSHTEIRPGSPSHHTSMNLTISVTDIALAAALGLTSLQAAPASTSGDTTTTNTSNAPSPAPDVDARGPHGVTPLMKAVGRQQLQSVLDLLHAGANPNARADDGASPVSLAVENYRAKPNGQPILMALFLAGGLPDTRRPNGDPVLMKFVNLHDCDGVRMMKSVGANLDVRDRGGDPVITKAALGTDWDVVWCLMELGARFDYEDGSARSPLSRSLANKAPSRGSPLFAYKDKVWRRLRDAGISVPPL